LLLIYRKCKEKRLSWSKVLVGNNDKLSILSENKWGYLECLYKTCQAAITDGGLFTDTDLYELSENERLSEYESEMKTVSWVQGPENRQEWVQTRLRKKGLFRETF